MKFFYNQPNTFVVYNANVFESFSARPITTLSEIPELDEKEEAWDSTILDLAGKGKSASSPFNNFITFVGVVGISGQTNNSTSSGKELVPTKPKECLRSERSNDNTEESNIELRRCASALRIQDRLCAEDESEEEILNIQWLDDTASELSTAVLSELSCPYKKTPPILKQSAKLRNICGNDAVQPVNLSDESNRKKNINISTNVSKITDKKAVQKNNAETKFMHSTMLNKTKDTKNSCIIEGHRCFHSCKCGQTVTIDIYKNEDETSPDIEDMSNCPCKSSQKQDEEEKSNKGNTENKTNCNMVSCCGSSQRHDGEKKSNENSTEDKVNCIEKLCNNLRGSEKIVREVIKELLQPQSMENKLVQNKTEGKREEINDDSVVLNAYPVSITYSKDEKLEKNNDKSEHKQTLQNANESNDVEEVNASKQLSKELSKHSVACDTVETSTRNNYNKWHVYIKNQYFPQNYSHKNTKDSKYASGQLTNGVIPNDLRASLYGFERKIPKKKLTVSYLQQADSKENVEKDQTSILFQSSKSKNDDESWKSLDNTLTEINQEKVDESKSFKSYLDSSKNISISKVINRKENDTKTLGSMNNKDLKAIVNETKLKRKTSQKQDENKKQPLRCCCSNCSYKNPRSHNSTQQKTEEIEDKQDNTIISKEKTTTSVDTKENESQNLDQNTKPPSNRKTCPADCYNAVIMKVLQERNDKYEELCPEDCQHSAAIQDLQEKIAELERAIKENTGSEKKTRDNFTDAQNNASKSAEMQTTSTLGNKDTSSCLCTRSSCVENINTYTPSHSTSEVVVKVIPLSNEGTAETATKTEIKSSVSQSDYNTWLANCYNESVIKVLEERIEKFEKKCPVIKELWDKVEELKRAVPNYKENSEEEIKTKLKDANSTLKDKDEENSLNYSYKSFQPNAQSSENEIDRNEIVNNTSSSTKSEDKNAIVPGDMRSSPELLIPKICHQSCHDILKVLQDKIEAYEKICFPKKCNESLIKTLQDKMETFEKALAKHNINVNTEISRYETALNQISHGFLFTETPEENKTEGEISPSYVSHVHDNRTVETSSISSKKSKSKSHRPSIESTVSKKSKADSVISDKQSVVKPRKQSSVTSNESKSSRKPNNKDDTLSMTSQKVETPDKTHSSPRRKDKTSSSIGTSNRENNSTNIPSGFLSDISEVKSAEEIQESSVQGNLTASENGSAASNRNDNLSVNISIKEVENDSFDYAHETESKSIKRSSIYSTSSRNKGSAKINRDDEFYTNKKNKNIEDADKVSIASKQSSKMPKLKSARIDTTYINQRDESSQTSSKRLKRSSKDTSSRISHKICDDETCTKCKQCQTTPSNFEKETDRADKHSSKFLKSRTQMESSRKTSGNKTEDMPTSDKKEKKRTKSEDEVKNKLKLFKPCSLKTIFSSTSCVIGKSKNGLKNSDEVSYSYDGSVSIKGASSEESEVLKSQTASDYKKQSKNGSFKLSEKTCSANCYGDIIKSLQNRIKALENPSPVDNYNADAIRTLQDQFNEWIAKTCSPNYCEAIKNLRSKIDTFENSTNNYNSDVIQNLQNKIEALEKACSPNHYNLETLQNLHSKIEAFEKACPSSCYNTDAIKSLQDKIEALEKILRYDEKTRFSYKADDSASYTSIRNSTTYPKDIPEDAASYASTLNSKPGRRKLNFSLQDQVVKIDQKEPNDVRRSISRKFKLFFKKSKSKQEENRKPLFRSCCNDSFFRNKYICHCSNNPVVVSSDKIKLPKKEQHADSSFIVLPISVSQNSKLDRHGTQQQLMEEISDELQFQRSELRELKGLLQGNLNQFYDNQDFNPYKYGNFINPAIVQHAMVYTDYEDNFNDVYTDYEDNDLNGVSSSKYFKNAEPHTDSSRKFGGNRYSHKDVDSYTIFNSNSKKQLSNLAMQIQKGKCHSCPECHTRKKYSVQKHSKSETLQFPGKQDKTKRTPRYRKRKNHWLLMLCKLCICL